MNRFKTVGRKTFVGGAQFGSEAKGAVVGYLARRYHYTAAVCAFPPSAGHTYKWTDKEGNKKSIMHMMLPISCVSSTIRELFIGPGALIDVAQMEREIENARAMGLLDEKHIIIHEHAGVVLPQHSQAEKDAGLTKIGSTVKGGMAAQIDKMRRDPSDQWVAREKLKGTSLAKYVTSTQDYMLALSRHSDVIIEGAQGFGLSMYHGFYPYTTARDTTPYAVFADCALPWSWASEIETVWAMRTYPIRVNNRDGSSGPGYPDQTETSFEALGQTTELTTVTKLPRRIFTLSTQQIEHLAKQACNDKSWVALTFADYLNTHADIVPVIKKIEDAGFPVKLVNFGPHDEDMATIEELSEAKQLELF